MTINGTAKTLIQEIEARLQPLKTLGTGQPGSSLVLALQDVSEDTFVSRFSFQYGLIVIKHTGLSSGNAMPRDQYLIFPETHTVSVYVGLKSLKNQIDALDVCRIVADQVVSFIPSSAIEQPRLTNQSDVETSQSCKCPIYRLDFELRSNYICSQVSPDTDQPNSSDLSGIITAIADIKFKE